MRGIYILTCRPTGRCYVGQSLDIHKRLQTHFTARRKHSISKAIHKHGKDNFTIEIIEYPGVSRKSLNAIEKWHIAKRYAFTHGYNETPGGDTNPMDTPEVRERQRLISSKVTAEMNKSPQRRERTKHILTERNKSEKSRERQRQQMREMNLRNWQGPEYRQKMIQQGKGNKNSTGASAETRRKRSRITKRHWQDPEYRETMSQHARGKNNSSYGKGKYAKHAGEIVALHQIGWTYRDIAEKYGGNRQTGAAAVRRLIKRRLQG